MWECKIGDLLYYVQFSTLQMENRRIKFAQHVIEEGHAFGPMNDKMDILHIASKGRMLDTLKRFHIYRETKLGIQINDNPTPSLRH